MYLGCFKVEQDLRRKNPTEGRTHLKDKPPHPQLPETKSLIPHESATEFGRLGLRGGTFHAYMRSDVTSSLVPSLTSYSVTAPGDIAAVFATIVTKLKVSFKISCLPNEGE